MSKFKISTELSVQKLDGAMLDLKEQFPEAPMLLLFYNSDCLGCTGRALPYAYQLSKDFPELAVIALHVDFGRVHSESEILEVFTSGQAPFPLFRDIDRKLYQAFKCEGTPHWILLDRDKTVVNSIFGSQDQAQNRLQYGIAELLQ